MGRIRRKFFGHEPMRAAERVLSSCKEETGLHCWISPKGALEIAVFLERHPELPSSGGSDDGKVRIAYRSWRPEEIEFTRRVDCENGVLESHDPQQPFKMLSGRVVAHSHRSDIVPGAVGVTRKPGGTKIEAVLTFDPSGPKMSDTGTAEFSFSFPEGKSVACPCC
jgi:hypothetical protein